MLSANESIVRAENKLHRISEEYEAYQKFKGQDLDAVMQEILALREVSRENLFDMGLLLYLKALRLKLDSLRLMADLEDMKQIDNAEAALNEIEDFYRKLEQELAGQRVQQIEHQGTSSEQLIPEFPEYEKQPEFDISGMDNPKLFRTIIGLFGQMEFGGGKVNVEIPQELLELTETIDMQGLEEQILARIREQKNKPATVRQLARGFLFRDNARFTLVLAFLACLFLENQGKVELEQGEGDIGIFIK